MRETGTIDSNKPAESRPKVAVVIGGGLKSLAATWNLEFAWHRMYDSVGVYWIVAWIFAWMMASSVSSRR